MDVLLDLPTSFVAQLQSPTLAFLLGGMVIAALGTKLEIPDAIYKFAVFMLLMKVGIGAGMEIREADLGDIAFPAALAALLGCGIVLLGRVTLAVLPGVKTDDAIATAGLFGAVSASTLVAGMAFLEGEGIALEAWVPALYPFMDIPALVVAIVLADLYLKKRKGGVAATDTEGSGSPGAVGISGNPAKKVEIWPIVTQSLRGAALTALLLGVALGLLTQPGQVFEEFYEPLFRGLLSILMLTIGMEAYGRIKELRRVAHWYAGYAVVGPLLHGLLGFGLGYIAHVTVGFSPGGVIMLAVLAASNSDVSGPPTLRAGIPTANPSTYLGASTGLGTPVAIALGIPLFAALGQVVFEI